MPITGSARTLAVGIGELCQSPLALPLLRANGSLISGSVVHKLAPHWQSAAWVNHVAHDMQPRCKTMQQYSSLASLLDPSLVQTSSESAIGEDVCVNRTDKDEAHVNSRLSHAVENRATLQVETKELLQMQAPAHSKIEHPIENCVDASDNLANVSSVRCSQQNSIEARPASDSSEIPCTAKLSGHAHVDAAPHERAAKLQNAQPYPSASSLSYFLVSNPVFASNLVQRDSCGYIHRLERRCTELLFENQNLRSSVDAANGRCKKTQELNLRLSREVQQARRERTTAHEEMKELVEKLHNAQSQAMTHTKKRRSALGSMKHQSAQTDVLSWFEDAMQGEADFSNDHEEARRVLAQSSVGTIEIEDELRTLDEASSAFPCDVVEHLADGDLEREQEHERTLQIDSDHSTAASTTTHYATDSSDSYCGDVHSWGCAHDCTYSTALLLAHRERGIRISRGPPGLELDGPPGLERDSEAEVAIAWTPVHGIRLAPVASLAQTRKHRQRLKWR